MKSTVCQKHVTHFQLTSTFLPPNFFCNSLSKEYYTKQCLVANGTNEREMLRKIVSPAQFYYRKYKIKSNIIRNFKFMIIQSLYDVK